MFLECIYTNHVFVEECFCNARF